MITAKVPIKQGLVPSKNIKINHRSKNSFKCRFLKRNNFFSKKIITILNRRILKLSKPIDRQMSDLLTLGEHTDFFMSYIFIHL